MQFPLAACMHRPMACGDTLACVLCTGNLASFPGSLREGGRDWDRGYLEPVVVLIVADLEPVVVLTWSRW